VNLCWESLNHATVSVTIAILCAATVFTILTLANLIISYSEDLQGQYDTTKISDFLANGLGLTNAHSRRSNNLV
jgi:hypothetical protein